MVLSPLVCFLLDLSTSCYKMLRNHHIPQKEQQYKSLFLCYTFFLCDSGLQVLAALEPQNYIFYLTSLVILSDPTELFCLLAIIFYLVSKIPAPCVTSESANVLRKETVQNISLLSMYFSSFGYPGTSCFGFHGC